MTRYVPWMLIGCLTAVPACKDKAPNATAGASPPPVPMTPAAPPTAAPPAAAKTPAASSAPNASAVAWTDRPTLEMVPATDVAGVLKDAPFNIQAIYFQLGSDGRTWKLMLADRPMASPTG